MKKTNPFRKAKEYLWNGRYPRFANPGDHHICNALDDVCSDKNLYQELCQYIDWLLMGEPSVSWWLIIYAGVKHETAMHDKEAIQAYRHRWLDHLAKEWDKDGGFPEHYLRAKELDSSEADSQISH